MGMTLVVTETEFLLKKEHFKLALDKLDRMPDPGCSFKRTPCLEWSEFERLAVYFGYVGFEVATDDNGDLTNLEFVGSYWGWQDQFFRCIGQYVEAASYINLTVEGDILSQFYFNGDCMIEKEGKITYE